MSAYQTHWRKHHSDKISVKTLAHYHSGSQIWAGKDPSRWKQLAREAFPTTEELLQLLHRRILAHLPGFKQDFLLTQRSDNRTHTAQQPGDAAPLSPWKITVAVISGRARAAIEVIAQLRHSAQQLAWCLKEMPAYVPLLAFLYFVILQE